ncbi:hypothetical protein [Rhodoligotrophos defluvii]|uniref:hypothetical protein n=1 Tax=Rhodoligotrophos defluvii TaxID=2561934 RepID=UPI0010C9E752|nr:hypothetical protein [Rhodoligotrophos defluvii]
MSRDEFEAALLRLGANFALWPDELRSQAQALVSEDPACAALLADFRAWERQLRAAVQPQPFGAADIGRVLSAVDAAEAGWRPGKSFWIAGASLSALSFVAGVVLMLQTLAPEDVLGVPLSFIALAAGQGDIGGLL